MELSKYLNDGLGQMTACFSLNETRSLAIVLSCLLGNHYSIYIQCLCLSLSSVYSVQSKYLITLSRRQIKSAKDMSRYCMSWSHHLSFNK